MRPRILEADPAHGFLLLDDLGSELYLAALQKAQAAGDTARADALMRDAIAALVVWQGRLPGEALPPYDDALLRRELALFPDWCVTRECQATWSREESATWADACDRLVASALAQPKVAVHRDWMPRNLMVATPNPGILDFQDAVHGPDRLRRRLPAARCLHLLGRGAGARLGGALLGGGGARPGCRSTATSASSGARSSGWACSATSRCSASSRA